MAKNIYIFKTINFLCHDIFQNTHTVSSWNCWILKILVNIYKLVVKNIKTNLILR